MQVIVSCDDPLTVGTVHVPAHMTDGNGDYISPQPIYIVREATKAEYEAQSENHKGWRVYPFYYEVSTD